MSEFSESKKLKGFTISGWDFKSSFNYFGSFGGHFRHKEKIDQKFWNDVRKGFEKDLAEINKTGQSGDEFWKKVWVDIHKKGYSGPEVLDDKVLREKLEKIMTEGKVLDEMWDNKCSEESVSLIWIPMMKRWRMMGASISSQEFEERMLERVERNYLPSLSEGQKLEYEAMKKDNRQQEFWRTHWKAVHTSQNAGEGQQQKVDGYHGYGRHCGPWR